MVAVAATFFYGQWRLGQTGQYVSEGPLVASLQSNVPISVKRSHQASVPIFDELMEKSKAAAAAGAELIVWPETMVQGYLRPDPVAVPRARELRPGQGLPPGPLSSTPRTRHTCSSGPTAARS